MYSERTTLDLVGAIYDAVNDDTLWPIFLDKFAHVLQARIGTLYIHDLRTQHGAAEIVRGMDPSYDRAYRAYYAPKNVYLARGRALLVPGKVMTSEELCPDHEVLRSEFYNDWIRPQDLRWGLNGVLFNEASLAGNVGAIRARGAKPFGSGDKRLLRSLMPHLQRAVALKRRIAHLEAMQQDTSNALDRWSNAVFVVDRASRILLANKCGVALLRTRDGLTADRNILQAATPHDSASLHKMIQDTAGAAYHGAAGCVSLIPRPSGRRAFEVFVSPSVRHDLFFCPPGTALVFVNAPGTMDRAQTEVLRRLYGLTPAETDIAVLIAMGKNAKDIADELGVRENTVRIHLKRIFGKTGTKRQAELVKLVLSGPAVLRN